jgi:hypothetical protein
MRTIPTNAIWNTGCQPTVYMVMVQSFEAILYRFNIIKLCEF